ncbi:type II toxin-antitoxin system VapC family toxin [Brooklawnia cerclae]|uniref:Uncharacterized protein n=1 Tax=Brooklawnia cerclae TaxID=349934 RepID=A0ABX0SIF0_9ACTN|nr:type II toxin-antitoxin system VapC family toxin [Brooklawnia cerclae]NIH58119.1 hypothetical protein [Brooklawnia cerclae]
MGELLYGVMRLSAGRRRGGLLAAIETLITICNPWTDH